MSKIINVSELQQYSLNELQGLYRKIQQEAANYPFGSIQYQNLIASLKNISRVIQTHRIIQPKPPRF